MSRHAELVSASSINAVNPEMDSGRLGSLEMTTTMTFINLKS